MKISLLPLLALGVTFGLSGCVTNTTHNGQAIYQIKCQGSPSGCLNAAYKRCKVADDGAYTTVHSDSHAGSMIEDTLPGTTVWYNLRYQCSQTQGRPPLFPWRGDPLSTPSVPPAAQEAVKE
ncbi:MAG: hypothetical protein HN842_05035 [Gammaproteobacteria bacterium]|jgi:hypothetical protein|nr:hypothetical protein [Gammaproteobacteria bacterium]MBT7307559.1 hypothetical protein [Gammaproteobacteria bacterium]